ncbi:piggyBac transposable element-derived protein 3-like [Condylostylus longicornis]|uniref:piggyBac transposable element-derived protein 3-like n=1 Tax=Condylostylus longicornis TaxID=2530218 RepID=UPI00244E28FE|nr:piggyBac transposable element-derived protein 3-like [Condylostylus longicornis]
MTYFKKYFPEEHYQTVVFFTKMYTLKHYGVESDTTVEDIKKFYGCNIIMGCLGYPRVRMYWADGFRNELIATSLSRNKFFTLRNIIHFVDTDKPNEKNKLWRIQPVIDIVKKRCNELATVVEAYSIDEQMIPFTGRCPARQVIRSKPRPVGLKNFVCATADGLVVDFEIFQGAGTFPDCGLGHGPSVVIFLTKCLPKGSHLYFDRFFTTIPLLERLNEIGFKSTGTIMANRLEKRLHLPLDRDMNRGDISQFVKNDEVSVVKWCDTKCVTIASTICGKDPVGEIDRWNRNLKRRVPVPIPAVILDYNENMNGVDICDQMMEYYRIKIKTKKWPVKVFFHLLDLAILNSWTEYRKDARRLKIPKKQVKDFLQFKIEIGEVMCKSIKILEAPEASCSKIPAEYYGSKYRPRNAPEDIRFDRFDHWPQFIDGTAKRCRNTGCSSRSRAICTKCNVSLCLTKDKDCFEKYHSK